LDQAELRPVGGVHLGNITIGYASILLSHDITSGGSCTSKRFKQNTYLKRKNFKMIAITTPELEDHGNELGVSQSLEVSLPIVNEATELVPHVLFSTPSETTTCPLNVI
jgi:hypothetical protein